MKTAELTGIALDWAVAKCEGYSKDTAKAAEFAVKQRMFGVHKWSTSWQLGGPIIEREKINTSIYTCLLQWMAAMNAGKTIKSGPTPLIAAMRCYVASKIGDEIEIPKELI